MSKMEAISRTEYIALDKKDRKALWKKSGKCKNGGMWTSAFAIWEGLEDGLYDVTDRVNE